MNFYVVGSMQLRDQLQRNPVEVCLLGKLNDREMELRSNLVARDVRLQRGRRLIETTRDFLRTTERLVDVFHGFEFGHGKAPETRYAFYERILRFRQAAVAVGCRPGATPPKNSAHTLS